MKLETVSSDYRRAQIGPLVAHVILLDENEEGGVEWYVTSSPDKSEWRNALFEGYSDSLAEAELVIDASLKALASAILLT